MGEVTLTPRQREIAIAFARGLEEREIAEAFEMTPSGVKFYSKLLRDRLGVDSTRKFGPELVRRGIATAEEILGVTA